MFKKKEENNKKQEVPEEQNAEEEKPKEQLTVQEVIDAIDGHLQRASKLLQLIK